MIGINSQIRSASGGSEGVGFAVPSDTVKRSIDQLRSDGEVRYAYLGVSSQALYPQLAKRLEAAGEERRARRRGRSRTGRPTRPGSREAARRSASRSTLVKPGGDVITKVNGAPVTREHDIAT